MHKDLYLHACTDEEETYKLCFRIYIQYIRIYPPIRKKNPRFVFLILHLSNIGV